MPARFLSDEWLQTTRRLVEGSEEFRRVGQDLTTSLLNVIEGAPGGKTIYVYYRFENGRVAEMKGGSDPTLADAPAEFKSTGSYETFAKINQGSLTTAAAVLSRKIKLTGSFAKAMKFVRPLDVFNKLARTVPTVY